MGWSLAFVLAAIIAAFVAFGGVASVASEGAFPMYLVFMGILVAALIWGFSPPRRPRPHA